MEAMIFKRFRGGVDRGDDSAENAGEYFFSKKCCKNMGSVASSTFLCLFRNYQIAIYF